MENISSKVTKLLVFIFIISFVSCNEITPEERKFNNALCKTWILEFAKIDGEVIKYDISKQLVTFDMNNTFTMNSDGKIFRDNWKYNVIGKYGEILSNNKIMGRIKLVNDEKLIFTQINMSESKHKHLKELELNFKPLK